MPEIKKKIKEQEFKVGDVAIVKLSKLRDKPFFKKDTIIKITKVNDMRSIYKRNNKGKLIAHKIKLYYDAYNKNVIIQVRGYQATNGRNTTWINELDCKKTSKKLDIKPVYKKGLKMGIEFECVLYYDSVSQKTALEKRVRSKGWGVSKDPTIHSDTTRQKYKYYYSYELITKTYTNLKKMVEDIEYVFDTKLLDINETNKRKRARVDFNKSTGTHMHFSSRTTKYNNYVDIDKAKTELKRKYGSDFFINCDVPATQELFFFRNMEIVKNMRIYMLKGIKHKGVKKGFSRSYSASTKDNITGRGAIHVGGNGKGTIEFRMCNLNGVKTKELHETLTQQIKLVLNTINYGYGQSRKIVKERAMIKLKEAKKLQKEAEEEIETINKAHKQLMNTFKKKEVNVDGKNDTNLFQ